MRVFWPTQFVPKFIPRNVKDGFIREIHNTYCFCRKVLVIFNVKQPAGTAERKESLLRSYLSKCASLIWRQIKTPRLFVPFQKHSKGDCTHVRETRITYKTLIKTAFDTCETLFERLFVCVVWKRICNSVITSKKKFLWKLPILNANMYLSLKRSVWW